MNRRAIVIGLVLLVLGASGAALRAYIDGYFPAAVAPRPTAGFSYAPWAEVLQHVEGRGRVDFAGLK